MMRKGTPKIRSLERTLAMLEMVIADGGRANVSALARQTGLPVATAHRQIATLVAERYLLPIGSGRHVAGTRLIGLLHRLDEKQMIASVAAPILHKLASLVRCVVQLGTLENDMVTYRIKTGRGADHLFTRVGLQLEAYCSGIGKVLLAHLPLTEQETYLAGGPFVALTERTIIDPVRMRQELDVVRHEGYAIDDEEVALGLHCIAAPICKHDGNVPAAISVSRSLSSPRRYDKSELLALLQEAARTITDEAFGARRP